MTCGHKWYAPYLPAPGTPREVTRVKQECALPLGHAGPHRSLANVTTPGSVSPGVTR